MKPNNATLDYKLYNLSEAQETFGISQSMLKKLILNKEITCVKIGVKNHLKHCDLITYIDSRTVKAVS